MFRQLCKAVLLSVFIVFITSLSFAQEFNQQEISVSNSLFCFDLYEKLKTEPGNLFFSPYSVSTALAMTYAGAKGNTASEMSKVLHFDSVGESINQDFKDLSDSLVSTGCQLNVANALWLQKGESLLPDYVSLVDKFYGGGLNTVNFRGATEEARLTINHWVEGKTQDKIKELLKLHDITSETEFVLTNAIYFKGSWQNKFKDSLTKEESFDTISGRKITAKMMHIKANFPYAEDDDLQVLGLPYQGDRLSMLVFLPKVKQIISGIEEKLSYSEFKSWLNKLSGEDVQVAFPRFKFSARYMLADTLKELGMKEAFSAGADFSGITSKKDIFISKVIHQAFVEVDEAGTEAAAATAIPLMYAKMPTSQEPKVFTADHPFIFVIYDKTTSSILFIGKVEDPSKV